VTTNRWGTYSFNSLADFENGTPATYTRTLTPRLREGAGANAALYLGDTWRSRALQLTVGACAEGRTRLHPTTGGAAGLGFRIDGSPPSSA
jgi:hypothetical protein